MTSYPNAKSPNAFDEGLEFQDFVSLKLAQKLGVVFQSFASRKYQFQIGEGAQGFEIKLDRECTRTGRLSIEVAEKSRDDPTLGWTPSGICRADNTWLYIHGNYEQVFIFAKSYLVNYFQHRNPPVQEKFGTIRTFYLPFSLATLNAAKVLTFPNPRGIAA